MSLCISFASGLRSREVRGSRTLPLLVALVVLFVSTLCSRDVHAFASTIRHGYTQCTPCHVDPSGAGPLTAYGRAIADEAIRMHFPGETESGDESPPSAAFLWGAVRLPDSLILQGDVRYARLEQKIEAVPVMSRGIWMQADMGAALQLGAFTASGSLGYAVQGAQAAAITSAPEENLISRYHWVGYSFLDGALMLRAGRMNLPYGLRVIEHTSWVRATTRTSIDAHQQYGVSLAWAKGIWRAELMGIVGNFALSPDAFRERGYSGYVEAALAPKLTLGATSLLTHRVLDPGTLKRTFRHAYGVFGRYATPWEPLVVTGELDYSLESPRYAKRRQGVVGFLQADVEFLQGLHLIATGEISNVGLNSPPVSYGAWLSYAWFFLPHADLRVDSIVQHFGSAAGSRDGYTFLLQGHVYL
jgi:hypothetical protein